MTSRKSVLLFGATGTAGAGAARALVAAGYDVTVALRDRSASYNVPHQAHKMTFSQAALSTLFERPQFDAVVSCLASRTGAPADAWAVDHQLQSDILKAAQSAGVRQFILLSAICVQKPDLAFQKAKLAFEAELIASGLTYSIVRPTAFFKSLSGQLDRLRAGKPFLIFGDGAQTACKPISDDDLGRFIAACLTDPDKQNAILPIGGPGPALTAKEQGALLFDALGIAPKYRSVPVGLLDAIVGATGALGRIIPSLKAKSELAKIGRYYATESMLVWDENAKRYNADATPEYGTETLAGHYAKLAAGEVSTDLREHAVF